MENWNHTDLSCSNPAVAKAFALALGDFDEWNDLDKEYSINLLDYIPRQEIKEVSLCFPDDVIKCCFSYGAEKHDEHHIVEFRNGEDKKVDIQPNYSFPLISIDFDKFNDLRKIYNKTTAFFRRLDKTVTDKEGNMFLDWFNDEVYHEFEYDGTNGFKFKVVATKCRDQIDLKVYERILKCDWWEIIADTPKVMHNPLDWYELSEL